MIYQRKWLESGSCYYTGSASARPRAELILLGVSLSCNTTLTSELLTIGQSSQVIRALIQFKFGQCGGLFSADPRIDKITQNCKTLQSLQSSTLTRESLGSEYFNSVLPKKHLFGNMCPKAKKAPTQFSKIRASRFHMSPGSSQRKILQAIRISRISANTKTMDCCRSPLCFSTYAPASSLYTWAELF